MRGLQDILSIEVIERVVGALVPVHIDRSVVETYFRKALRLRVFHRLDPLERAFLLVFRRYVSRGVPRSPVVLEVVRRIFIKIEMASLRGRAVVLGALTALKRGLTHLLERIGELLVIGLQYINTPELYRGLL